MINLRGISVSPGVIVGYLKKYQGISPINLVPDACTTVDIDSETTRLLHVLEDVKTRIETLWKESGVEDLIPALQLIAECIISESIELVKEQKICGSLAIKRTYEKYSDLLRSTGSQLFAIREVDLKAIVELLIKGVMESIEVRSSIDYAGGIIVCNEIGITDFISLIKMGIKGLVTRKGGVTSHVAIAARANGIPYVIIPDLNLENLVDGTSIILDGLSGQMIVDPDEPTLRTFTLKAENYLRTIEKFARNASERAVTIDGRNIKVLCNVGDLEEARVASKVGCDGIGLFRIEFLYMRNRPPGIPELRDQFEKISGFLDNKPVVIRAPDIGGDKPVEYLDIREDNPFMGLRGIRLLLEYKNELFKPFLEAFLQAYKTRRNLKLLIPMVSRLTEVIETMDLIREIAGSLNIDISTLELGAMIETPSAALLVDKLAETGYIKFVSYGTNDLTQYVLAVDRTNPKVGVIYDDLDPAVLRLLYLSVNNAVKHGLEVEVCGELASKQLAIPILLGFGVNDLSINYVNLGVVKYTVRNVDVGDFTIKLLPRLLSMKNGEEVRNLVREYLSSHGVTLLE